MDDELIDKYIAEYHPECGLTKREWQLMKWQGEAISEVFHELKATIAAQAVCIKKLESDVDGLVSLLGES